jgi:alcohol dehydrogenase YqhD (iron-dependent ADH family)
MKNFEFHNPVRITFGPGEFSKLGEKASQYGKRALLVKMDGPLEEMGVYKRAIEYLKGAGMEVDELGGVAANPKLESVYEGIEICRDKGVEIIIAVGGGSAIDCAKAIGMGAKDSGDVWDFFTQDRTPTESLPLGVVSTIAATGSEMSVHCVITNEKKKQKYATHYELHLPKFAIIDAELHATVPKYLTACGMCDTIAHTENYFAGDRHVDMTDRISEGVAHAVIQNEGVLEDLKNVDMRNNLAWAATIAINGLTDLGRGAFEYGGHVIEHAVSRFFDVNHGAGLAVILPAWMEYRCEQDPARFAQWSERVFSVPSKKGKEMKTGMAGISKLKEKFSSWGLPKNLKDLEVPEDSIADIAEVVVNDPDSFIKDKGLVFDVLNRCK